MALALDSQAILSWFEEGVFTWDFNPEFSFSSVETHL